jgi:hypothetical protein
VRPLFPPYSNRAPKKSLEQLGELDPLNFAFLDVDRVCFVTAPIVMPLGFFLSVASPKAARPNALIALVPIGGLALAVGAVTLGIGLL